MKSIVPHLLFIIIHCAGFSQQSSFRYNINIGSNILVAEDVKGISLIEPHIVAHPKDSQKLLLVAMRVDAESDSVTKYMLTAVSTDGGITWQRNYIACENCGDPWLSVTEKGAVLTSLGMHTVLPETQLQALAFFSADDGKTWHSTPQTLGTGHDGPRSVAAKDGTIYIATHQGIRDKGKVRFRLTLGKVTPGSKHVRSLPSVLPGNLNIGLDGMFTLADGTLILTYSDFQRPVNNFRGRSGILQTRRVWAIKSIDKGETFSIPFLVCEGCYGRSGNTVIDTSASAYRDRIYQVCFGDKFQSVLMNYSTDGGEEWTDLKTIETPSSSEDARYFPQIAVNNKGIVAIAWMDRRDDSTGNCYAPYIAFSSDGGKLFQRRLKWQQRYLVLIK